MGIHNELKVIEGYVVSLEDLVDKLKEQIDNMNSIPKDAVLFDPKIHTKLAMLPVTKEQYKSVKESYQRFLDLEEDKKITQKEWAEVAGENRGLKYQQVLDIAKEKYDYRRYLGDDNES